MRRLPSLLLAFALAVSAVVPVGIAASTTASACGKYCD